MNRQEIHNKVIELVLAAAAGTVTQEDVDSTMGDLIKMNYSSLAFTSLIVALEENFVISVDPTIDPAALLSIDKITDFVCAQLK